MKSGQRGGQDIRAWRQARGTGSSFQVKEKFPKYKQNMKEFGDIIKRPHLQIIGIEGKELDANSIKILSKVVEENSPI